MLSVIKLKPEALIHLAIGTEALVEGDGAMAIGASTRASQANALAIGSASSAYGINAVALDLSDAEALNSIAIGYLAMSSMNQRYHWGIVLQVQIRIR